MQPKLEPDSEFSERTEHLAEALTLNLKDLPEKIGVSPAMFYAYRSGKYPISKKAWRKLEAAEKAAGIQKVLPIATVSIRSDFAREEAPPLYLGQSDPKKSLSEFLRSEAEKQREQAAALLETARRLEEAADLLDGKK